MDQAFVRLDRAWEEPFNRAVHLKVEALRDRILWTAVC
jgi:hypothetical protein